MLLDYIRKNEYIAVDIETTGLDWKRDEIVGIAIYTEKGGKYFPIQEFLAPHEVGSGVEFEKSSLYFKLLLRNDSIAKVFHNANFDLKFLERFKILISGPIIDTLILAQLIDENAPLGLKDLSKKYLGEGSIKTAQELYTWLETNKLQKKDLYKAPPPLLAAYAMEDVTNTYNLAPILTQKLEQIHKTIQEKFHYTNTPLTYFEEEAMPIEGVLRKMEMRGVLIDQDAALRGKHELELKRSQLIGLLEGICWSEIHPLLQKKYERILESKKSARGKQNTKFPTFNWNSTQQVGDLFFNTYGFDKLFPKEKTPTQKWICSEHIFKEAIGKPEIFEKVRTACQYYFEFTKVKKSLGTDVEGLIGDGKNKKGKIYENGRVHSSFRQVGDNQNEAAGTGTGRLSSAGPNLQNIPPFARSFYIPDSPQFVFLYFDYSQIELALAAHISNDPLMVSAFVGGKDLHSETAKLIFKTQEPTKEQRQIAKTTNYLLIYNGSPYRLQKSLFQDAGINISIDEAKRFRELFFETYPTYAEFLIRLKRFMFQNWCVIGSFGRVRRIPELKYSLGLNYQKRVYDGVLPVEGSTPLERYLFAKKKLNHALNQGFNFPEQTFAASIIKRGMLSLQKENYDMVNQIHDSLFIQVEKPFIFKAQRECQEILESVVDLRVPLKVEGKVLTSFSEKEPFKNLVQVAA